MDHESDITMKQFIFLFCTYFQQENNLKFLYILKPSSRPQTMLEVGIFVLFLILKSLVQNQHGWFLTQGYLKGIQRVFVIGFDNANVSLAHFALTEIGFSAPTRTH